MVYFNRYIESSFLEKIRRRIGRVVSLVNMQKLENKTLCKVQPVYYFPNA